MPKASICIPTYNSARFLGEAIDSALAQTFADFELIVCDNASTDETSTVCATYGDRRLRYHRFDTLVGQGGNWNRCVALATGEYVALLHADDIYLPDFLAERLRQFEGSHETGIAFGAVGLVDESGLPIGQRSFSSQRIVAPLGHFYGDLLLGCVINPASLMVRRSSYESAGPFNEQRLWGIDWEMWLRLAAIGGVSYSPRVSSRYRIHGTSGSSTGLLGPRYLSDDLAVLRPALDRLATDPALAVARSARGPAMRSFAMRALFAAGANCEAGLRLATFQALAHALHSAPTLITKPSVWALAAGAIIGPRSYRAWKTVRGGREGPLR